MQQFQSILVGVDLSDEHGNPVASQVSANTQSAIETAKWLAKQNSAKVTFLNITMPCLELSHDAKHVVENAGLKNIVEDVEESARQAMLRIVEQAREEGITAKPACACGKAWYEMIRTVVQQHHDLLIIGSHRGHRSLNDLILGSTGKRLLRKCPCPVWVTSPSTQGKIRRILAPTDFTTSSDAGIQLAQSLATGWNAELHLLHVIEMPFEHVLVSRASAEQLAEYREGLRRSEEANFDETLARNGLAGLVPKTNQHMVAGTASTSILSAIQEMEIDLVVMGTVARSGLTGLLVGNTAEQLLPNLPCSILALKPDSFQCPVRFPEAA